MPTPDRRAVITGTAPAAIGPYSQGIAANGFLFCSGQIPVDPGSGEIIEGGVGDHTRQCLENLAAVCAAAGADLNNAVRISVYATDLAGDWAEINEAYSAFFTSGEPPARAAIGVAALPKGARVEVDAIVLT